MSPHQVIAVAVRLFAILLGTYALRTTSATLFAEHVDTRALAVAGAMGFLTLVVAVLLWFFPLTAAKKLLSSPAANPAPEASTDTWFAMGCALIGLWLLATAIPAIVRDALFLYSSQYDDPAALKNWLAYRFVEILIAVWLIVGARGFLKVFWWARTAGTTKAQ